MGKRGDAPPRKILKKTFFSVNKQNSSLPLHPGYGSQKHHLPLRHILPMHTQEKNISPLCEKSRAHVCVNPNLLFKNSENRQHLPWAPDHWLRLLLLREVGQQRVRVRLPHHSRCGVQNETLVGLGIWWKFGLSVNLRGCSVKLTVNFG